MRGTDGTGASMPDRQRADSSPALRPLPAPAEPVPPLALDPARAPVSVERSASAAASGREASPAPQPETGAAPGKRARVPDGEPEADRAQKRPRMRGQPGDAARRSAQGAASPSTDPGSTSSVERESAGSSAASEAQGPLSNGAEMAAAAAAVRRAGAARGLAGARVAAKLTQLLQAVQVRSAEKLQVVLVTCATWLFQFSIP